jgi:hypothetical protein
MWAATPPPLLPLLPPKPWGQHTRTCRDCCSAAWKASGSKRPPTPPPPKTNLTPYSKSLYIPSLPPPACKPPAHLQ